MVRRNQSRAYRRNEPSYRERLRALAGKPASSAVAKLIPDVELWAGQLLSVRNGLAHLAGENTNPDYDLMRMTSSLLVLMLMAEIGLDSAIQDQAASDAKRYE